MKLKVINSGSKGNGYALITDEEILLIECGVPVKETMKAIDYQTAKVVGCLCSHVHLDHCGYIKQYMSYGIGVFTSDEVHSDILTVIGEKTKHLQRMKRHKIGSFSVIPFSVPHNWTECDGWLIEQEEIGRLLFITDAEYCPYDFSGFGISQALIECNYSEDYIGTDIENRSHVLLGHMELKTCKRLIESINTVNLRSIGLLHLSSQNSDSERFRREIRDITETDVDVWIAEKGYETEIGLNPF